MISDTIGFHSLPMPCFHHFEAFADAEPMLGRPALIARPDGKIVWCNMAWCTLCAFNGPEDAIGRDLRCIQGPGTDKVELMRLMDAIRSYASAISATLINYDRHGMPFRHTVDIVPLADPQGEVSLFRATSRDVTRFTQEHGRCTLDTGSNQVDELDGRRAIDTCCAAFDASNEVATSSSSSFQPKESVPRGISSKQPSMVVLTRAQAPYPIVWASEGWLDVCGYSTAETIGMTMKLIQGPGTDRKAIGRLMEAVRAQTAVEDIPLINYDKRGQPFQHLLSVQPVFEQGLHAPPTLYRATSTDTRSLSCGCPLGAPAKFGAHLHRAATVANDAPTTASDGPKTVEDQFWAEELEQHGHAWKNVDDDLAMLADLALLALERRVAKISAWAS